jgi:hypothetical protein
MCDESRFSMTTWIFAALKAANESVGLVCDLNPSMVMTHHASGKLQTTLALRIPAMSFGTMMDHASSVMYAEGVMMMSEFCFAPNFFRNAGV